MPRVLWFAPSQRTVLHLTCGCFYLWSSLPGVLPATPHPSEVSEVSLPVWSPWAFLHRGMPPHYPLIVNLHVPPTLDSVSFHLYTLKA